MKTSSAPCKNGFEGLYTGLGGAHRAGNQLRNHLNHLKFCARGIHRLPASRATHRTLSWSSLPVLLQRLQLLGCCATNLSKDGTLLHYKTVNGCQLPPLVIWTRGQSTGKTTGRYTSCNPITPPLSLPVPHASSPQPLCSHPQHVPHPSLYTDAFFCIQLERRSRQVPVEDLAHCVHIRQPFFCDAPCRCCVMVPEQFLREWTTGQCCGAWLCRGLGGSGMLWITRNAAGFACEAAINNSRFSFGGHT